MSAVYERVMTTVDSRYEGGFDRMDRGARVGRAVLWRASEQVSFALGDGRSVWVWDAKRRIWDRTPAADADIILREHDLVMARLRRAVPVIRLYLSIAPGGERDAARQALQRIGTAIVEVWQEARARDNLPRGAGWFDSAAAVYRAVTQDVCHHLPEAARIPFDPAIFAELAAAEQQPRASEHGPLPRDRTHDWAGYADEQIRAKQAATHPAWDQVESLRADIERDVSYTDAAEISARRRRKNWAVLCGIAGGICTATALLALTN